MLVTKAPEMPQFYDFRDRWVFGRQPSERLVESEQAFVWRRGSKIGEFHALILPAVLVPVLSPGIFDKYPSHCFGCRGKKMTPADELLIADEPEVCLVDQRSGIECLAGGFGEHFRGGEFPQFVIDEREEVGSGSAITGLGSFDESGHLGHAAVLSLGGAASHEKQLPPCSSPDR